MLEPINWKLRCNRMYGVRGARPSLTLCTGLKFPLLRIEASFKQSDLIPRAGTIQQVVNGVKSEKQIIPFENRYYVFPTDLVPYSLFWSPIASLPSGYLQVWEYVGELSQSILNQFIAYSNGDSMPLYGAPQTPTEIVSKSSSITDVASSATAIEILPNNPSRLGFGVFNLSTSVLYIALGEIATATNFTAILGAGYYYEPPINFTGFISGIWASANGSAKVTELS